jgi:methylmalonyl-CoA/ethylmalonyl-CoA epimerase
MPAIKRINHVAFIVDDIDAALRFWQDSLGLNVSHVESVPEQDVVVAFLPIGETDIEIIKPTNDESGVARFLRKHGPGMHHICFEVDDITSYLERLKAQGIQPLNDQSVIGAGGKSIAFIHPKYTHGVLVELCELPKQES